MPNTLIPIQTYTLSSTASSVTFSNIPQNYTDLKIVISARTDRAAEFTDYISIRPNGSTSNLFSRFMYFSNTTVGTSTDTVVYVATGSATATANTYGSAEFYIPNYTSSTNYKNISAEGVTENNSTSNYGHLSSGLWSSAAAITSLVFVSLNGVNWIANSTFTLYGISNGVKATGGTLTVAGGYAYHTFTSTGSFLPNQQIKGAEVLCVAGGGGGGNGLNGGGGGGGAGGVIYSVGQTFFAGNSYTAVVGAGAAGGTQSTAGEIGSKSLFSTLAPIGGGGGSNGRSPQISSVGGSGGAGGGANSTSNTANSTGSIGTSLQGNSGGNGGLITGDGPGGGGGGAGAAGSNATTSAGGAGGIGIITNMDSGASRYYAGGGGGGAPSSRSFTAALGGIGGGGAGSVSGTATAGTANTGGGGGGGGDNATGGAGGSGIIIIRYPLS